MKKLFLILGLVALTWSASAQSYFVTAGGSFGFNDEVKSSGLELMAGKELNDTWALGVGGGVSTRHYDGSDISVSGYSRVFMRFTAWHNEKFFTDLGLYSTWSYYKGGSSWLMSFAPSLRYRINEHFDISTNVAIFTWERIEDHDDYFYTGFAIIPSGFTLYYRF